MDIQEILVQLKDKFGDKLDISKITDSLKDSDLSKFNFNDIISKLSSEGLLGDLDGDGVQESLFEEIKGKLGSMFHH